MKANGMIPIVGTLPILEFSPFYAKNRNYTEIYSDVVRELSKTMSFDICDMSGLGDYLIDGVHFTHEGYNEVAKRWAKSILTIK